jgi:hypothetical protein
MTNPRRMQMARSGVSTCTTANGNEVLLIHSDTTTDGSTTFTDSTGTHTMTSNGGAAHDTAQAKFGESSMLFDGADDYVTCPAHANFNFGSGLWSIDFWYRSADSLLNSLVCLGKWDVVDGPVTIFQSDDGDLAVNYNLSTGRIFNESAGSTAIDTGAWVHIAVARTTSTTLKAFINGTEDAGQAETVDSGATMTDLATPVSIGQMLGRSYYLNGWIDEVRIIKGAAPWTSNFTPPEAPYCN